MKSFLLVLTVIRNAETRSIVRKMLEEAGHRVTQASGRSQAQSLLDNGFVPDLVLFEAAPTCENEAAELRAFLLGVAPISTCLIVDAVEMRSHQEKFATAFLTKPVKRDELESLIESLVLQLQTLRLQRKGFTRSKRSSSGYARGSMHRGTGSVRIFSRRVSEDARNSAAGEADR